MPKRTSNSSVNSSIRQNTTATNEGFSQLLELQRATNDHLDTIRDILKTALVAQEITAVEDIDTAKEINKEEALLSNINNSLKKLTRDTDNKEDKLTEISKTLKDIAKSLKESIAATIVSSGGQVSSSNAPTQLITGTKSKEDKTEAKKAEDEKNDILKTIEKNTRHKDLASRIAGEDVSGLGKYATALAIGLGTIVGAIQGQIKAISMFAKMLTPDFVVAKISKSIASFAAGISMQFDLIKAAASEKFSGIFKFIDAAVDTFKGLFKESGISKIISSITSGFTKFFDPFIDAFKTIKDLLPTMGEGFGKFSSLFKGVTKVVGKIFYPLTIVMTLWDTVKGAIEGFEKDGIVGGIAGAIKGFFNSLIFGPVDMVKDAAAWVLGMFGFDKAKEVLESFNLEKMFSSYIDAIFSPVETFKKIMNKFNDFLASLSGFTIPEFSFTIPVIDKKISIGPFKPFGEAAQKNDTTSGSSPDSTVSSNNVKPLTQTSVAAADSTLTSNAVTIQSNNVAAMKEQQNGSSGSTVVAPSINNNVKQTQIAKISAPVRISESTIDRYFSSRLVY